MTSATPRVAFCGLGLMGTPMARRLLDAGIPVTVWNRDPAKCRALGGVPEATAGALRILVGGDAAVAERCRPLLEPLGEVVHVGPIGAGSAVKQVVNAAVAPMVALLAERAGREHGLPMRMAAAARQRADDAIEAGLGDCDYSVLVAHARAETVG